MSDTQAPAQQREETKHEFDDNNPRARRVAETIALYHTYSREQEARLMRYRDVVDAAEQHRQAMRAVYGLAMPYSAVADSDTRFEFLDRGDFVTLLDMLITPLENALKTCNEAEVSHEQ